MKIVLLVALWFFNQQGYTQQEHKKAIQDVFKNYKTAIVKHQPDSAFSCLSSTSKAFYTSILKKTKEMDSITLSDQDFVDQVWVLSTRQQFSAKEIEKLTGKQLFAFALEHNWIHKEELATLTIATIELQLPFAMAQLKENNVAIPYFFQFRKEKEVWKIELTTLLETANRNIEAVIEEGDADIVDFILTSVKQNTNTPLKKTIWLPIKKKQ